MMRVKLTRAIYYTYTEMAALTSDSVAKCDSHKSGSIGIRLFKCTQNKILCIEAVSRVAQDNENIKISVQFNAIELQLFSPCN